MARMRPFPVRARKRSHSNWITSLHDGLSPGWPALPERGGVGELHRGLNRRSRAMPESGRPGLSVIAANVCKVGVDRGSSDRQAVVIVSIFVRLPFWPIALRKKPAPRSGCRRARRVGRCASPSAKSTVASPDPRSAHRGSERIPSAEDGHRCSTIRQLPHRTMRVGIAGPRTPRRKSQPALASHATSGFPFMVQRNGFAIVALK